MIILLFLDHGGFTLVSRRLLDDPGGATIFHALLDAGFLCLFPIKALDTMLPHGRRTFLGKANHSRGAVRVKFVFGCLPS